MKAFLLAAGRGTRLRPLTDVVPKCLVPVRGEPLLKIWLEILAGSRIDEVIINLHSHADIVEEYLHRHEPPVKVHVIREETLLGSAGTLLVNRAFVESDSAFWVLYSDVLTNTNLGRMAEFHGGHSRIATLGLYRVPDPSRCGVAIANQNGVIVEFEEKPKAPRSDWAFTGLMVASPRVLDFIPQRLPADISFDVLPSLVGNMMAYPIEDFVLDIGTMLNYRAAESTWPGLSDVALASQNPATTAVALPGGETRFNSDTPKQTKNSRLRHGTVQP
jgi:mannose-1-phosphate guanylyltransferase